MTGTAQTSPCAPEGTDLERRVLAHERILKSLIAYMSSTEPRFVNHLRGRYVEPMKMARHEQSYRDADDYAEEFIRAVMLIVVTGQSNRPEDHPHNSPGGTSKTALKQENSSTAEPDRVLMKERNGVWEVRVDGAFKGDYHKKEQALAAVALAKLSLIAPQ